MYDIRTLSKHVAESEEDLSTICFISEYLGRASPPTVAVRSHLARREHWTPRAVIGAQYYRPFLSVDAHQLAQFSWTAFMTHMMLIP